MNFKKGKLSLINLFALLKLGKTRPSHGKAVKQPTTLEPDDLRADLAQVVDFFRKKIRGTCHFQSPRFSNPVRVSLIFFKNTTNTNSIRQQQTHKSQKALLKIGPFNILLLNKTRL